jgi:hypothetical protein
MLWLWRTPVHEAPAYSMHHKYKLRRYSSARSIGLTSCPYFRQEIVIVAFNASKIQLTKHTMISQKLCCKHMNNGTQLSSSLSSYVSSKKAHVKTTGLQEARTDMDMHVSGSPIVWLQLYWGGLDWVKIFGNIMG